MMVISKAKIVLHYKSFEIVAYWYMLVYIAEIGKIWLQNTFPQIKLGVLNFIWHNIHCDNMRGEAFHLNISNMVLPVPLVP